MSGRQGAEADCCRRDGTERDIYSLSDVYSDAARERDWGTPSSHNSDEKSERAEVLATPRGGVYFTQHGDFMLNYL